MNKIIISGRIGSDPRFTVTKDGKSLAKFSVGVTRKFDREKTDWFNCVVFASAVVEKFIKPFVHKGDMVICSGEFQFNEFQKQDGTTVTSNCIAVAEIDLCSSNKSVSTEEDMQSTSQDDNLQPISDSSLPF